MRCDLCSEANVQPDHEISENHLRNQVLHEYSVNKKQFTGNRKGVLVTCNVKSSCLDIVSCAEAKIKISVRPNEDIKFNFAVLNDCKKESIMILFIQMPQNRLNFSINDHGILYGSAPLVLKPKQRLQKEVYVCFKSPYIGQYEMPIIFSCRKVETGENIVIMRDMVVYVEEKQAVHEKVTSPYALKNVTADKLIKTHLKSNDSNVFRIPKNFKPIYAAALNLKEDAPDELKEMASDIREIFDIGVTKENYIRFFHNLLWYEETIVRINLKKYNMTGVPLAKQVTSFALFVPGLAEKRPSLMLGDLLFVKPQQDEVMFEGVISEINENTINIRGLDDRFLKYYSASARFDIRFFMSRMPLERMHQAVDCVIRNGHEARVFPVPNSNIPKVTPINNFYNLLVENNPEQRLAVERIVAGTAGRAPFLLHGPPGTGKTVTIVEAVLQLVEKDPRNRIMVCTDSNMAADHVGTLLIKYAHLFATDRLLLRANSKYRVWETLPECLYRYSNGTSYTNFEPVSIDDFLSYRIVITTLSHAAKFARDFKQKKHGLPITHLFIDEAAQASEPASLIPTVGLLEEGGELVLAGDPLQLGPVVISHDARRRGLGMSLMERLMTKFPLYSDEVADPNYTVMLLNNFRSNKDILDIPNELFYKNKLKNFAEEDPISRTDILGERKTSRAIVFHGVLSQEQRMGKSPSYFNNMELEIVQMYVTKLVNVHRVRPEDIGIVTPYIRQVYKIKSWLAGGGGSMAGVEVGTVEAFQGKEKRVILVSTVRANCGLLDHDARFQLGFLVDDKRFNVAITRAKAKAIVIGNPLCLEKDHKWRRYMEQCRALGTYCGFEADAAAAGPQQEMLARIAPMLQELKLTHTRK